MYQYEYPRAALTVDAVVFTKHLDTIKVLLIQRKNEPFKDHWAFPGGFLDMHETLEMAVERELVEETGLKNIQLIQLKTYSTIDRDPRGRTISTAFIGLTNESNTKVEAGDDAKEARWYNIKSLPQLAFDHKEILTDALKALEHLY